MFKTILTYLWKLPLCAAAFFIGTALGGMAATALGLLAPELPADADQTILGQQSRQSQHAETRAGVFEEIAPGGEGGSEVGVGSRRVHESNLSLFDDPVGGFDKAEIVDPGIGAQRYNQTDIGSFRGFNGAYAAVVRRMHIPHFKSGSFAG